MRPPRPPAGVIVDFVSWRSATRYAAFAEEDQEGAPELRKLANLLRIRAVEDGEMLAERRREVALAITPKPPAYAKKAAD